MGEDAPRGVWLSQDSFMECQRCPGIIACPECDNWGRYFAADALIDERERVDVLRWLLAEAEHQVARYKNMVLECD